MRSEPLKIWYFGIYQSLTLDWREHLAHGNKVVSPNMKTYFTNEFNSTIQKKKLMTGKYM